MTKKNFIVYLFLALVILFFSGCIDVEIEQELREDGSSDVVIKYDFSGIISSLIGLSEGLQSEETNEFDGMMDELCEDGGDFEHVKEFGFDCSVTEDGVLVLRGEWQVTSEFFEVKKGLSKITYTYNPSGVSELFDKLNTPINSGEFYADDSSEDFVDTLPQLKRVGGEITYTVTMPANIEFSDIGVVSENRVIIDVFDFRGRESVVIVASKVNPLIYYVGASAGVVLLVLVIMIIVNIRRKSRIRSISSPSENGRMSEEELMCKEYILKYKSEHSRDSIGKGLVNHGVSKEKVDEYLDKYF